MSKLDQTRTEIETLLRQFQAWGLAILQERKAELERSIAESGGQIPVVGSPPAAEAQDEAGVV